MMDLNLNYIRSEVEKMRDNQESKLLEETLNYDGPLPVIMIELFDYYTYNSLHVPPIIRKKVTEKHGENFTLHGRYEHFKKEGETFKECDNRLIKKFMNKTGLPVFK